MSLSSVKRGFTLIELLVVIAIIAILASILFPVFAKAREKARQTTCTSNQKQLTTALQIYVQDNNGKYPGANWSTAASGGIDVTSLKVLLCPDDPAVVGVLGTSPISYGYNGLLIKADGLGVSEAMIPSPTMVGAFADAVAGKTDGAPGLIGGSANLSSQTTDIAYRHNMGAIVSYVDGHAKLALNAPNTMDINAPINQAFISAPALGYLTYEGSGIGTYNTGSMPTAPSSGTSMMGDYSTMPILAACANIMNAVAPVVPANQILVRNFMGSNVAGGRNGFTTTATVADATMIVGCGDGMSTSANSTILGRDVVVAIKAKNPTPAVTAITTIAALQAAYSSAAAPTTYTYDRRSGTRTFWYASVFGALTPPTTAQENLMTVAVNDYDMVQKVANDPGSIGYCSAAFADPNIVDVLTIDNVCFPSATAATRLDLKYMWPSAPPTAGTYPFTRTLYAQTKDATGAGVTRIALGTQAAGGAGTFALGAVQSGPLFKLSYFPN